MSSSYCKYCQKDTEDKIDTKALFFNGIYCSECNKWKEEETKKLWAEREKLWEEEDKQKQQKIIDCKAKGIPCCPKCASTSVQPVAKGFSLLTGFIGSGKTLNYCLNCGNKWKP